jgi:hypothetical protein
MKPYSIELRAWPVVKLLCGTCMAWMPGQVCPWPSHITVTTVSRSSTNSSCCNREWSGLLPDAVLDRDDLNRPVWVNDANGRRIVSQVALKPVITADLKAPQTQESYALVAGKLLKIGL